MVRGSLVTLIFEKTLRMSTSAVADASAITLMSTDIERIGNGLIDMHETYSNLIEVVLALWLLARLLQIAVISSAVVVVGKLTYTPWMCLCWLTNPNKSMFGCWNPARNCLWQYPEHMA